mmetsp:Transcript_1366/g.1846  ORF Transcript_1366/g.1846 Transcript_1366/m.1846 type:complete len:253 (+) Transcript_1366:128-886(+)
MLKFSFQAIIFPLILCDLGNLSYAQNLPIPPLPYEYDSLEPFMDEATMRVHHLGHHAASTHSLNKVLAVLRENPSTKPLAKLGIDQLLHHHLHEVPEEYREPLINAGGGYVNHELFWASMVPNGGGDPSTDTPEGERFTEAVATRFGSINGLREDFTEKALEVFGSGWAWLVYNSISGKLDIITTPNQENPAMDNPGYFILIALDLWEHAYYIKHQNSRLEYIEDFFSVISWDEVIKRFDDASKHLLDHNEL